MTPLIPYKDLCSKYTPEQYKQSSRLLGIINAILKQCDDLEIAFFEILQALSLADAMGPALDYLGAIVGISRSVGEDDSTYRTRIVAGRALSGLPTPEALRRVMQFITGCKDIGLYPCWPAGMYFVVYGQTQILPNNINDYYTSGVDIGEGTFLCCENGEEFDLIVYEDNYMPMVVDKYDIGTSEFIIVDDEGFAVVDDEGSITIGTDFI